MKLAVCIILYLPLFALSQTLTSITNINVTKYWHQETMGYTYPMNIFVPSGDIPENGFPVCVLLHGNGRNGVDMINQFKNVLECHVLVAPSGYLNSWNICNEDSDAPDLEMIDDLINHLQTYSNVNPDKIRILGSSNGGGLANNVFITNKNSGIDIVCAVVSHLNELQFHLDNFYSASGLTDPSISFCGYDSLVVPLTSRKYLSISNDNDSLIPYYGGPSVVGVDLLNADSAAFYIASNQGYSESQIIVGTTKGDPEITEYSYLSGDVVHIKSDAEHGTNITQREYIKSFFSDCSYGLSVNPFEKGDLTIYPNPTKGSVFINTPKQFDEIRVYSTQGTLLMKSNGESLTISSLSSGTYIFEIEFKDKVTQRRVFKR
tara:strand:+ start:39 stop:1166 length:1128 start_codon:yes stop_codon:yes gene_type:complete